MLHTPKTLDVITLQLPTRKRYRENLDILNTYLRKYNNKHIVVVPEVFLTAFDYEHMSTAAKFSANALKTLKKEVNEQIVILTLILKDGDDFVNQAVVIHKHKVVHRQNKVKLFKLGDEDLYFHEGKKKKIRPFMVEGVTYAILICFELRFKELWGQIEGADVVIIPSRWGKLRKLHLEILSRALAVMNQCYVIVSNSSDKDMARGSCVVLPTGEMESNDTKKFLEKVVDFREIKKMRRYIVMK